jgi:hypothetical protein
LAATHWLVLSVEAGKDDVDGEAAAWSWSCGEGRVVGICHSAHNGETEADAVACGSARPVELLEGLEQTPDCEGRNEGPGVADGENRRTGLAAGLYLDSPVVDVVPNRIRDEIRDEEDDQVRSAAGPRRLERDDAIEAADVVSAQDAGRHLCEVDRLRAEQAAATPREVEARIEQSFLLPACIEKIRADLSPRIQIRVRIGEGQLEQCALRGQRSAQLMCDIGRKALLNRLGNGRRDHTPTVGAPPPRRVARTRRLSRAAAG